jgi:hypothetical protein
MKYRNDQCVSSICDFVCALLIVWPPKLRSAEESDGDAGKWYLHFWGVPSSTILPSGQLAWELPEVREAMG